MVPDFLSMAQALSGELASLRETIHRCPELGNQEFRTAALVEERLQSWGIETERPLDTAVVGILRGALPGPTVGLRADMDALPVTERSGAAFASEKPGIMHACGHDVHTAAALGAAKLLSGLRERLPGTVRFFFQPDEEGRGGAARMIAAGCMGDAAAVFGCHVAPDLPAGTVGVRFGKFYAASDTFTLRVLGKSAHGARREEGIDALGTAAKAVSALLALPEELLPERSVVTVGTFHSGTAENVLAETAELRGILRSLGPDSRAYLRRRFRETAEAAARETGARVELELRESYGGIVNTDRETELVRRTAAALLGEARVRVLAEPTMTTEDFGCFTAAASGSFYHIGAGCEAPLHSPEFLPAPGVPVLAAALHAAVLWAYLHSIPGAIASEGKGESGNV